jgi:hypothetical protein
MTAREEPSLKEIIPASEILDKIKEGLPVDYDYKKILSMCLAG